MFAFQLVFERSGGRQRRGHRNNIPFVFDDHCPPFKMKNTRGREGGRGGEGSKEGRKRRRSVSDFQTNGDSAKKAPAAPPLEQISLKNSALLLRRKEKQIGREEDGGKGGCGQRSRGQKGWERERAVTRNFGQLDRH